MLFIFNPQLFKVSIIQTKLFCPLDFELSRFHCIPLSYLNVFSQDNYHTDKHDYLKEKEAQTSEIVNKLRNAYYVTLF